LLIDLDILSYFRTRKTLGSDVSSEQNLHIILMNW